MLARRSRSTFIVVISLMLMAACSRADSTSLPPAVQALAAQGLAVMKEFDAGKGIRAFVGIVNDRPIAVYVLADGNAIVGTRLNAKGEPLDDAKLEKLIAKPMSEKDWERLKTSTWVLDGKSDAPRIVYVFTDANCPYCHRFWEAARPWVDAGKVQIRDILVGVIKEDSPAKAAAILDAPDRSAALLENEKNYAGGGIAPAPSVSASVRQILDTNQTLMMAMGFQGTPGIVVRDSDGLIRKYNGMPQQSELINVLGPL